MRAVVLRECGYEEAMLGLSLSYNRNVEDMPRVAEKLYCRDDSESKFLRFLVVWMDIRAPRYWWQQFDTYRHVEKQSESTMHTIMKGMLDHSDFVCTIPSTWIGYLNSLILAHRFEAVKAFLPEGFLQRRIIVTNYQTLRRIIKQRKNHKLKEWREFIAGLFEQLEHQEFLADLRE